MLMQEDIEVRTCIGIEVIFVKEKGIETLSAKTQFTKKNLKKIKQIASHYNSDNFFTEIKIDNNNVILTGKNLGVN